MVNQNKKSKIRFAAFRRLICLCAAVLLVFGSFAAALPVGAAGAGEADLLYQSGYDVKVTVKVVNDADGWESAKFVLYTRALNGTDLTVNKQDEIDIMSKVSSAGGVYTYNKNLGLCFPTEVRIYTDFGGGFTWREWEADVKIYVNGTVVKAEHIYASSGAFSSSDKWHKIPVDAGKYPYPETIQIVNHRKSMPELPDTDNFYEFVAAKNAAESFGDVFINACDQYGTRWDYTNMQLKAMNSGDGCKQIASKASDDASAGMLCRLSSTTGTDHRSEYAVTYSTASTLYPTVTKLFEVGFYFTHKLSVVVNDETIAEKFGTRGKIADLSDISPVGYSMTKLTLSEGTGKINGSEFVFANSDAVVTASVKANAYKVIFDGNGATSGSMNEQSFVYDTPQKLTGNAFQKTDNKFAGWNTKPDGSGTAYANREKILNMTEEQDAEVTLYAQWVYNGPVVTLVYPQEMGRPNETIQTGKGGSVKVEEKIPAADGSGHYRFVSSDKPLENITTNQTIVLTYVKEAHDLETKVTLSAPTCLKAGALQSLCACGYSETTTLDALGHLYGYPDWKWSADNQTAAAAFTCQRCNDVQNIQAEIKVTDNEKIQLRHYAASVKFDGSVYGADQYKRYRTIAFDLNGGTGSIPTQKILDDTYTVPQMPAAQYKKNCGFAGWMLGDALVQPGDAVEAGNMTLVAQWSFTWNDIQKAVNGGVRSIILPCDVTADSGDAPLTIPSGKTVTIDLNGYTIRRDADSPTDNGSIFRVDGGTLSIEDNAGGGQITGGNAVNGGAVYVTNGGRFALYSGTITMNNASANGGAIYADAGKVYLRGGEIVSNRCGGQGAVYMDGAESLLAVSGSPKITANGSSGNCGGVYIRGGAFEIAGAPVIAENCLADGSLGNVLLEEGLRMTVSDTLESGAVIGITGSGDTVFTQGLSGQGSPAAFKSDNYDYIPSLNDGGEIILVPHTHTFDDANIEWKWSEDHSEAELVCRCAECDFAKTYSAEVTTQEETERTVYRAVCSADGKKYSDEAVRYKAWDIFVGGIRLSGDNYKDVCNDGTIRYDAEDNTLTLENATIEIDAREDGATPDEAFGILYDRKSDDSFRIVLKGTNKIVDKVGDSGLVNQYGIAVCESAAGLEIGGNGVLRIETRSADGGVAYYGIKSRTAVTVDKGSVIINLNGTAKAIGIELVSVLTLKNKAAVSVSTGDDENACSLTGGQDTVQLSVASGCYLKARSGNQAFGETIAPDDRTKSLGAVISSENGEDNAGEWDRSSPLTGLKYIRIPYGKGPGTDDENDPENRAFAVGTTVSSGRIMLIVGTVVLIAAVCVIVIRKKKKPTLADGSDE